MAVRLRADPGPLSAAVLATGLAALVLAAATLASHQSAVVRMALRWYGPAGAVTGQAGLATVAWLLAWLDLGRRSATGVRSATFAWRRARLCILVAVLLVAPPLLDRLGH